MNRKTILNTIGNAIAYVVAIPAYLLLRLLILVDGDSPGFWTECACKNDGGA